MSGHSGKHGGPDRGSAPAAAPWGRFDGLVGTGGIGRGSFFAVRGDHTLGREESRGGRFLDRRDYCKLHVIAHYVRRLTPPSFRVLPVGKVGDDEHGRTLREEMRADGLDTRWVTGVPGRSTLFSFCLVYPDGSGGNLTVDDSASADVSVRDVEAVEPEIAALGARGMVLAAPEVPLDARLALLALGTRHGSFRAASFTSDEITPASAWVCDLDLLAVNADEAAALAGVASGGSPEALPERLVRVLGGSAAGMMISMTAGRHGSWFWDGEAWSHQPVYPVPVASTAGAGDAHLSGLLSGLAAGLTGHDAHVLAALAGSVSATHPDTINKQLDRAALARLASTSAATLPAGVRAWLGDAASWRTGDRNVGMEASCG